MDNFSELVAAYGIAAKNTLNGPGEPEAALSRPVASLLENFGEQILHRTVVLHEEVREDSGNVRPDYAVRVDKLISGHIELKRPGTSLDPTTYGKTTHNGQQWKLLRNLPNLLHTNGLEWRLWRYGELVGSPVHLDAASLVTHKGRLTAPPAFETMLTSFLGWGPTPITSITRLVDTIAPLAALLREEVLESLKANRRHAKAGDRPEWLYPFIGLKRDWRASLYPHATDEQFADGFAQTVVFALVIALSEGISFTTTDFRDIATGIQSQHSLLGRSLDLLTEHLTDSTVGLVIETITRTLSATQWDKISGGNQDVYLHLYEHFLEAYDPELRKQSGSYYTPADVVKGMTRLADQALKAHMGIPDGLSSPEVAVIDPAMGTGTYPLSVIQHVAEAAAPYGKGAVADEVTSAAERLYGIELQSGPFSVAELRLSQAIREYGGVLPNDGLHLFVADTLEDPTKGSDRQLSYTLQLIAKQREQANKVKLETPIQVCIGNPPYKDKAEGLGGWIEQGYAAESKTPLDDFRSPGNGKYEYVLKNLYVYFWRWAMWKVFESIKDSPDGVVCFITATGYLNGPGFRGMREWIRRNTSHGWIINLTPEGKRPPAKTAVFNIETEVAIALFVRKQNNDLDTPANIKYTELHGTREQKFEVLGNLDLDDERFEDTGTGWKDGFVPAVGAQWASYPALNDLYCWIAPGVKPNRTWVYAPSLEVLQQRWDELTQETNIGRKRELFKETDTATLEKTKRPLPSKDAEQDTWVPFDEVKWPSTPAIIELYYRSFDRQYLIADSRLLDRSRPTLWAGRSDSQIFLIEQHAHYPKAGPGVMFSHLITDMDTFNNRGGRTLPTFQPDGSPNVAPGLLEALSAALDRTVTATDLSAYVAGVSAHPEYVDMFSEPLHYSGNHVPITADAALWDVAVEIGYSIIWLHTYGHRGQPMSGISRIMDAPQEGYTLPSYDEAVGAAMPEEATYDEATHTIHLGAGRWSNVAPEVWGYTVGGVQVIDSWVGYRRKKPKGRKSSSLNEIITTSWPTEWSRQFSELLAVLTHLVHLEKKQSDLLHAVVKGELLSRERLETDGVRWPDGEGDRVPKFSLEGGDGFFIRQ